MTVCATAPATRPATDPPTTSETTAADRPAAPAADVARPLSAPPAVRLPVPVARPVPVPAAGVGVLRPGRRPGLRGRVRRLVSAPQAGMSTAEYAVGMLAACGFAGLLLKVLTSSTVSGLLTGLVKRALTLVG